MFNQSIRMCKKTSCLTKGLLLLGVILFAGCSTMQLRSIEDINKTINTLSQESKGALVSGSVAKEPEIRLNVSGGSFPLADQEWGKLSHQLNRSIKECSHCGPFWSLSVGRFSPFKDSTYVLVNGQENLSQTGNTFNTLTSPRFQEIHNSLLLAKQVQQYLEEFGWHISVSYNPTIEPNTLVIRPVSDALFLGRGEGVQ